MELHCRPRVIARNTIVVGSGAAGWNAADRLYQAGQTDIALVTEGINMGTSRNTGSDKQTYYKLTLAGGAGDSVREMAQTLYDGQCVDGDLALCEAALSAQGFFRLAELGVPFPRSRYGEYVGYRTDHDPRTRATSVGPYTSRAMTEVLEKSVRSKNIDIFDRMQAVRVLSDGRRAAGLLCLDLTSLQSGQPEFVAFCCKNLIFATGGPAGIYADSVYPLGHCGATGMMLRAGAKGQNLTEWQYGLASVAPRWNVSGTYMQVIPRFVSTEQDGSDPREFLYDSFDDEGQLLTCVFLKGYQWPFDVSKLQGGSSIIDLLVYQETLRGRRVFLDFRSNPHGAPQLPYDKLSAEARDYLHRAGAEFGTPLERLLQMNAPAVEFYRTHGVDLAEEMLEIALCAQHNNGGVAVDCWWQTGVEGLFAAGECAGTHGVYRPGGSALNAGQVGSTRAAQYIAARRTGAPDEALFDQLLAGALDEVEKLCGSVLGGENTVDACWQQATTRMSQSGAAIREEALLQQALEETCALQKNFGSAVHIPDAKLLGRVFRLEDVLLCQQVYLSAMLDYRRHGGQSRGSALYADPEGEYSLPQLPGGFRYGLDGGALKAQIQQAQWTPAGVRLTWRAPRPIPETDDFFENVWKQYREDQNIR